MQARRDLAVASALHRACMMARRELRDLLGEVGLGGEIRPVSQAERRLAGGEDGDDATAYMAGGEFRSVVEGSRHRRRGRTVNDPIPRSSAL